MKTHSTKAQAIRSAMAVFHHDGTHWVVIRGFKGTEVLGRFINQQDAQVLCEKHNVELAKIINA
jgi:predicted glycosyltransferase